MDNSFSSPGAPPQLTTPPPVITPPPPAKPRKSWGWMIVVHHFDRAAGVQPARKFHAVRFARVHQRSQSRLKNSTAREVGPKLDECILEDNDSHNKIAVVTVDGIIASTTDQAGNNMVDVIKAQLDRAADDKRVKAVILKVDSPGGEVMASDEINKAIVKFQERFRANP